MNRRARCLLLAVALAGCRDATAPSAAPDLTGEWSYAFEAVSPAPCSDPGLQQGCSGVGRLRLSQSGRRLQGASLGRSGCQSCAMAWDMADAPLVDARLVGDTLEFRLYGHRFVAGVPAGEVDEIGGTVSCRLETGLEVQGTWRMTRAAKAPGPARGTP